MLSREGFSIGETAAIVGVSTDVIRSWERRLSLGLNHRTRSNQRRYWMEDIQRFIAIRRHHESGGLPLVESAARAMKTVNHGEAPEPAPERATALDAFWAGLVDQLPEMLIVIDEAGRITAANEHARAKLNLRYGVRFTRLAPGGWRRTYRLLHRSPGRRQPMILAMRARSGILFVDARVVPVGQSAEGPVVLIGTRVREQATGMNTLKRLGGANGRR